MKGSASYLNILTIWRHTHSKAPQQIATSFVRRSSTFGVNAEKIIPVPACYFSLLAWRNCQYRRRQSLNRQNSAKGVLVRLRPRWRLRFIHGCQCGA